MITFIQFLITGLRLGSVYALIALGYTMVYGIIKLINFAHGDFIMVGGYTMIFTIPLALRLGLPAWAAVLAGVVEPASATPVIVEDNVLVGANAVVIEGCRIGHGAVVAAGAVVVGDVAPNTVVAGCPARVIKQKDEKTAAKTALVDALRTL